MCLTVRGSVRNDKLMACFTRFSSGCTLRCFSMHKVAVFEMAIWDVVLHQTIVRKGSRQDFRTVVVCRISCIL